jgi:hypothetical protein
MPYNRWILVGGALVLFGAVMRLTPHLPNATPTAAIAFVGSWYLGRRWSIILPSAALLLSDAFIGFYDVKLMASVYGSFALIGFLSWFSRRCRTAWSTGLAVASAALLFFLITNAAVWLFSPWYEKTLSGLYLAYVMGLPFLRSMLIGDVAYTLLLCGIFETVSAWRAGTLTVPHLLYGYPQTATNLFAGRILLAPGYLPDRRH